MGPISRQDVQNIVEASRNRIFERAAMKQDLQPLNEMVKNLVTLVQQNQQLLRQAEYQRSQMTRRAVALESRLSALEQEIRPLRSVMTRMVEGQHNHQPQIAVPQPSARAASVPPEQQYLYRAA